MIFLMDLSLVSISILECICSLGIMCHKWYRMIPLISTNKRESPNQILCTDCYWEAFCVTSVTSGIEN